ncbi:hypothetical protein VB691_09055 [Crocosphaera sp. XPORK-15E]|nr:hypothetical protein [Crocosphaera sp. XPORK-15E]
MTSRNIGHQGNIEKTEYLNLTRQSTVYFKLSFVLDKHCPTLTLLMSLVYLEYANRRNHLDAEDDLLLSALLEQIDYCILSRKETMNKKTVCHYQDQGEKFRSKLKQLSMMQKKTYDFS